MNKIMNYLAEWFGLIGNENCLKEIENKFLQGEFESLYNEIQSIYKSNGLNEMKLYRWETNTRDNKILESWCTDKMVALSYKELRHDGKLIEKVFDTSKILFDVRYMFDIIDQDEWDEEFGMYPCDECIIII